MKQLSRGTINEALTAGMYFYVPKFHELMNGMDNHDRFIKRTSLELLDVFAEYFNKLAAPSPSIDSVREVILRSDLVDTLRKVLRNDIPLDNELKSAVFNAVTNIAKSDNNYPVASRLSLPSVTYNSGKRGVLWVKTHHDKMYFVLPDLPYTPVTLSVSAISYRTVKAMVLAFREAVLEDRQESETFIYSKQLRNTTELVTAVKIKLVKVDGMYVLDWEDVLENHADRFRFHHANESTSVCKYHVLAWIDELERTADTKLKPKII